MGVFSEMKPRPHVGRNGFDLSRFSSFSSKVGPIKEVMSQLTLPNSDYELDLQQLCRTQPLNKAAFTGFSLNYDAIWVPLNNLYTGFNKFIAQSNSKDTVFTPTTNELPNFSLGSFVIYMLPVWAYDYISARITQPYAIPFATGAQILLPRYILTSRHSDSSISLSVLDALDMYGYGNFLPMVKKLVDCIDKYVYEQQQLTFDSWADFERVLVQVLGFEDWDFEGWCEWIYSFANDDMGSYRFDYRVYLAELFDYQNEENKLFPTLWPVLAYNKAFYEYYRSEYYDDQYYLYYHSNALTAEEINIDSYATNNYVYLFNVDDFATSSSIFNFQLTFRDADDVQPSYSFYDMISQANFARLISMLAFKPHLYKRDLFTGVLPSTQVGDVSVASAQDIWSRLLISSSVAGSSGSGTNSAQLLNTASSGNIIPSQLSITERRSFKLDPGAAISVLELRRADAMQRFKERMLRAGDKVKDRFRAHGWDEPISEKSYEPIFLGSFDGRLDINTVASTTQNEQVDLGQLAANGVAVVSGNKIHFKSHDFGILIVNFHITKDAVYNSYGLDPQHMLLELYDFPFPEIQNISLQPVQRGNLTMFHQYSSESPLIPSFNDVIGYLPSYMQFKTAIDKVHGEFYSDSDIYDTNGVFSDWVAPRRDSNFVDELSFLYIHPSCADNIFVVAATDLPSSDQFIINVRFDLKAVQPLSVMGLPL